MRVVRLAALQPLRTVASFAAHVRSAHRGASRILPRPRAYRGNALRRLRAGEERPHDSGPLAPRPGGRAQGARRGALSLMSSRLAFPADGPREVLLVHPRAAADVQLFRLLVKLLLGAAVVPPPADRLAFAAARGHAALGGTGIGRSLAVFRLPVIADFFERMLKGGECRAVRAFAFAVFLYRVVMRFDPGPLRLGRRALDRTR